MTWFKVDDGLYDHAKMLDLRSRSGWQSALALWTLAGAWSSKQLKDGVVPKTLIAYVGCSGSDADLLVDVGLWERTEDGFQFHDWLDCNPSRDSVEERRKKTRDKVAN